MTDSKFGGVGRPSKVELARQRQQFRELVGAGVPIDEAARQSGIKAERALEELTPIVQSLLQRAA